MAEYAISNYKRQHERVIIRKAFFYNTVCLSFIPQSSKPFMEPFSFLNRALTGTYRLQILAITVKLYP